MRIGRSRLNGHARLLTAIIVVPGATSYTLAISAASGGPGAAVTLTATPVADVWPTGAVLTPSATTLAGTWSPTSFTPTGTNPVTFTFTPSSSAGTSGTLTVTVPGMTNSTGPKAYAVTAAPGLPVGGTGSSSGTLSSTSFDQKRVFNRDAYSGNPTGFSTTYNKGWGEVAFNLTPNAAVSTGVWVRLHDASSSGASATTPGTGTVLQAALQVGTNLTTGANTLKINIPAGLVWFYADFALDAAMSNPVRVTSQFGVGAVFVFTGTSHAAGYAGFWAYPDTDPYPDIDTMTNPSPFGVCYAPFDLVSPGLLANTWQKPGNRGESPYTSSFAGEFLNRCINQLGVVCALIGRGEHSGGNIIDWEPVDTLAAGFYGREMAYVGAVLDHAGWKFEAFIWQHGVNDQGSNRTRAQMIRAINRALSYMDSKVAAPFATIMSTTPMWGGANTSSACRPLMEVDYAIAQTRPNTWPLAMFDCGGWFVVGHLSMIAKMRMARMMARYCLTAMGPAKGGLSQNVPIGPTYAGTATRTGKVIDIPVNMAGGTQLLKYKWWEVNTTTDTNYVEVTNQASIPNSDLRFLVALYPPGKSYYTASPIALDATNPVQIVAPVAPATQWVVRLTLAVDPGPSAAFDFFNLDHDPGAARGGINAIPDIKDNDTSDGFPYGRQLLEHLDPIYVPPITADAQSIGVNQPLTTAAGAWIVLNGNAGFGPPLTGAGKLSPYATSIEVKIGSNAWIVPTGLIILNDNSWSGFVQAPATIANGVIVQVRRAGQSSADASTTVNIVAARDTLPAFCKADAVAMYDSLNISTLFADAACTVPATQAGTVAGWKDALGTASNTIIQPLTDPNAAPWYDMRCRVVKQSAGWATPSWERPYVCFDPFTMTTIPGIAKAGSVLGASNPAFVSSLSGSWTIYVSLRTGYGGYRCGFSIGTTTTSDPTWKWGGKNAIMINGNIGAARAGPTATVTVGLSSSAEVFCHVIVRYDNSTGLLYIYNKNSNTEAVSAVSSDRAAMTANAFLMGAYFGTDFPNYSKQRVSEFIPFGRFLSNTERDDLITDRINKWTDG